MSCRGRFFVGVKCSVASLSLRRLRPSRSQAASKRRPIIQAIGQAGYAQVWIAHTIFGLPLIIYLLHNFVSEIPGEVIEAARVDGAGHGQIFFRIILPLTTPAIASVAIFQFP